MTAKFGTLVVTRKMLVMLLGRCDGEEHTAGEDTNSQRTTQEDTYSRHGSRKFSHTSRAVPAGPERPERSRARLAVCTHYARIMTHYASLCIIIHSLCMHNDPSAGRPERPSRSRPVPAGPERSRAVPSGPEGRPELPRGPLADSLRVQATPHHNGPRASQAFFL